MTTHVQAVLRHKERNWTDLGGGMRMYLHAFPPSNVKILVEWTTCRGGGLLFELKFLIF